MAERQRRLDDMSWIKSIRKAQLQAAEAAAATAAQRRDVADQAVQRASDDVATAFGEWQGAFAGGGFDLDRASLWSRELLLREARLRECEGHRREALADEEKARQHWSGSQSRLSQSEADHRRAEKAFHKAHEEATLNDLTDLWNARLAA